MKTLSEQVAAAAAAKEAEKEKKRRRPRNRRPKQNLTALPGGGCIAVDSEFPCGPSDKLISIIGASPVTASKVAFNSLPIMHLNTNGEIVGLNSIPPRTGVVGGGISKSCPLPASSYPTEGVRAGREGEPHISERYFDPHWSDQTVEEAIKKGHAFKAVFRINAHNPQEAYCTIDGLPVDVLINGVTAQNRAIEGDVVAVMLDPAACWTKLKGAGMRSNPVSSEGLNTMTEARVVIYNNDSKKEQVDTNYEPCTPSGYIPLSNNGYQNHENSSFSEAVSSDIGNGSVTSDNMHNGCNSKVPTNSARNCDVEQGEATRALGRICAMISYNQSKRPTGRVLSIIRKSPRREAVVGFLALKPWLPEGEVNGRCSSGQLHTKHKEPVLSADLDYIQLIPTDFKLPKMVVAVGSLPDCAKERLKNCDMSIERELIAARIDEWTDESSCPKALVIHLLGQGGEIEPQISAILFQNAIISASFSPESLTCLPDIPWKVPEQELKIRKDLRNICTFTIDPPSAVDLDDALSIEQMSDKIFRIGVHIADVSYFVLPDTALDTEAQVRSTSVYILQHKVPMLPPKLSEEVASLLPGEDRFAFSVIWDIDDSGNIINRWIGRSVINSCCKMSYDMLQDIIDTGFEVDQLGHSGKSFPELHGNFELKDVLNSLRNLHEMSNKLNEIRFKDGALQLDNPKIVILFDENGIPHDSFLEGRKDSCSLNEEFMLLANKSVAEVISRAFPDCALLRRHPKPNLRKLKEFESFCSKHGFELDGSTSGKFHLSLSKIREKLKDDPVLLDILISYASKPMQTATYFCSGDFRGQENGWAHYALSIPYYTHFTSPLRRYPDIIVHRTLSAVLESEEVYLKLRRTLATAKNGEISGEEVVNRCFTNVVFDKNTAESEQVRTALSCAALKFKVPVSNVLGEVAAHCNERKLASKHAEEAGVKLYLWTLLKKREVLLSQARVLALGPRFMTIYVNNFAIERRIYYDEVEGLYIEWLETTGTLVLDLQTTKTFQKKRSPGQFHAIEDVALVLNTSELVIPEEENKDIVMPTTSNSSLAIHAAENTVPLCFPLVLQNLSTIPVALHAVGGYDGPVDIMARLYACSYFK
ncbi:DIS3-like exonuclease 2 [Canna indica]|uniref:DIS3-like exonuclease 2 n=1 Tax=Canna indica TaxID=4628 RepID=A0AAQ3JQL8_9LILI|nr:DIS3-like exonuclease 2 [Canna indica]